MPRLELLFLGPPKLALDGAPLSFDRRKAIALLAYLALSRGAVSREVLADLFWPDTEPSSAFAYLRRALWELNRSLGPGWLESDNQQICLVRSPQLRLDTDEFQALLKECPADDGSAGCMAVLEKAVELYRGDFLAGFSLPDSPAFEDWQLEQAESLRRGLTGALEKLSNAWAQAGDLEKAVSFARRWLALDPLEEAAHRQLMRLLARQGQRLAALRQYETCAQTLNKELGIAPQPETTALYEQIRQGSPHLTQAIPTRPVIDLTPTPAAAPHLNLPSQPTSFVGRRRELDEIGRFLRDPTCRLLTLVGPGGIGKTRLAIQAALEASPSFADGVHFVPLAGIASPDSILAAVGKTLQLSLEGGEPLHSLQEYLRPRQLLLILDNYEHLISDTSVEIPVELLDAGPGLKVLVTSRESLNISSEQLYPVSGMRTPPDPKTSLAPHDPQGYSSVRLFLQSARRQQPDFNLDASNTEAVMHICRLVQGMPLAIELSAGWIHLLGPAEIRAEIERSLDFLETNRRDVPPRQRSIRAVFESSWSLLAADEANSFNALSVFKGGFTRDAAQAVAGVSIRQLAALEHKSLLQVQSSGRYELHPLLAEYAAELLRQDQAQWQQACERHAACYFDLLARTGEDLKGPRQIAALAEMEADLDNIHAAWQWANENRQVDRLDQGLLGLFLFYSIGYFTERQDRLLDLTIQAVEAAAPASSRRTLLLAKLLALRANSIIDASSIRPIAKLQRAIELVRQVEGGPRQMGIFYGILTGAYAWRVDHQEGLRLVEGAVDLLRQAGDPWAESITLRSLGELQELVGQRHEAALTLAESVEISRRLGDKISLAYTLFDLGNIWRSLFDLPRANQFYAESLAIAQELGQKTVAANIHFFMADILGVAGEMEQAQPHYQAARQFFQEMGNGTGLASVYSSESIYTSRKGDYALARQLREKSLAVFTEANDHNGILWSKWELGEIERLEGNFSAARQQFEESRRLFGDNKTYSLLPFYYRGLADIALAEGRPDEASQLFGESLKQARATDHFWAASLALSGLGRAALASGQEQAAREHFLQALRQASEIGNQGLELIALAGLAALSGRHSQEADAAALASFVIHHVAAWRETREWAARILEDAASRLEPAALEAALQEARLSGMLEWLKRFISD